MKTVKKIMNYVMPDCKEVAELASFSMDETLPLKKRVGLKLHIMMCKFCSRNYKQLYLIRKLIRNQLKNTDIEATVTQSSLSEESRQRISATLPKAD